MNNQDLTIGEDIYYWELGTDNYQLGTINSIHIGYYLIKNDERVSPLAPVRIERISRDRMDIVKLIANASPEELQQNKASRQLTLF